MYKRLFIFLRLLILGISFLVYQESAAQWVYKTPSGAKYHTDKCHTVKNVSERLSLANAIQKGLDPCKICKPPVGVGPSYGTGNKSPAGQGQTVQCSGLTKAGTRCKHKTGIGNGFCFQHQPK